MGCDYSREMRENSGNRLRLPRPAALVPDQVKPAKRSNYQGESVAPVPILKPQKETR